MAESRTNAHRSLAELAAWTHKRLEPALEPELPIVDAHFHLRDDARGRYLIDDYLADIDSGHNIVAGVYMENGFGYRNDGPHSLQSVGEVESVNAIARGQPQLCAGIVGHADLTLGAAVQPVLESLIAAGGGRLHGIRHGVACDPNKPAKLGRRAVPPRLLLDPTFRKGFARLQPLSLSFDVWQFHTQLPELNDLLRAFPDADVILNHVGGVLGIPPYHNDREAVFAIWRNSLRELAQYPNLTIKIGGLGMLYCGWDFHLRDLPPSSAELATAWRPYIETCIETFGAHRCMVESNFPVDKQSCGYGVLWNALKRITQHCSAAEKAFLYRDTAVGVYRLVI